MRKCKSLTVALDWVALDGVGDLCHFWCIVPLRGSLGQGQEDKQEACYPQVHLVKLNLHKQTGEELGKNKRCVCVSCIFPVLCQSADELRKSHCSVKPVPQTMATRPQQVFPNPPKPVVVRSCGKESHSEF